MENITIGIPTNKEDVVLTDLEEEGEIISEAKKEGDNESKTSKDVGVETGVEEGKVKGGVEEVGEEEEEEEVVIIVEEEEDDEETYSSYDYPDEREDTRVIQVMGTPRSDEAFKVRNEERQKNQVSF